MKYVVELSQQAQSDIRAIGRWLEAHRSIEISDRWMRAFARIIVQLETDPSRFPFAEEAADLGVQLRVHHLGSKTSGYRIIFVVNGQTVRVARVRHAARDSLTGGDI